MAKTAPKKCKDCGKPAEAGRARCAEHLAAEREAQAKMREERRAKRLCTVCGEPVEKVTSGPRRYYMLCAKHREYYAARKAQAK